VTLTAPSAGAETDGSPRFAGTAEPGSVTVVLSMGSTVVQQLATTVAPDGTWRTAATGLIAPGAYTVRAEERDAAGNLGTSAAVPFTVDAIVAAAGDIACDPRDPGYHGGVGTATECRQRATSDLLVDQGYHRVFALGDNQYDNATLDDFQAVYDPSWGRVKGITTPVVGNHEYQDPAGGAKGYFDYFDGVGRDDGPAGPRGTGWHSFELGDWHVIVLNSNCTAIATGVDTCAAGSVQERWLRDDLASHAGGCTLALWHHPRYSSGNGGNATAMQAIWADLAGARADLVLNGHSHGYERFAPKDAAGAVVDDGLREIVVGTGGEDFYGFSNPRVTGSDVSNTGTFGVLRLTLRPGAYDWRFVPIAGSTFTDSGTTSCH
jgi:hypothetical protein